MKLLYVCNDFGIRPDGVKGCCVHLRAITRALADRGNRVRLLSPYVGIPDDHPAQHLLPDSSHGIIKTIRPVRQWLRVHGETPTLADEFRPIIFNASARDSAIKALRDEPVDAIIERLSLLSTLGADLAEELKVPLIVEVNAIMAEEARSYRNLYHGDLAKRIEGSTLQKADALMAVSDPLAQALARRPDVDPSRVFHVPNGADTEAFANVDCEQICKSLQWENRFVVGFVGSLKVWHGVDVLLEAFSALWQTDRSVRLLIVGTGPEEDRLHQRSSQLGLDDAVHFVGGVPHEKVPDYVGAMDVAVAPFRRLDDFYFSPLKVFEYMAGGVSVVASRMGQLESLIRHGENGLLFEPDDASDLFDQLDHLRRNGARRHAIGEAGRQTIEQQYTWQHVAAATESIIQRCVNSDVSYDEAGLTSVVNEGDPS